MIEISYREFQRGFCKLKGGAEEILVYGRGGEVLGTWTPAKVGKRVVLSDKGDTGGGQNSTSFKALKERFDVREAKDEGIDNLSDTLSKSHLKNENPCRKCGGEGVRKFELENATGEWEEMWVCMGCIKKFKLR